MSIVTLLRGTSSTGTGRLSFVYVTGTDFRELAWEAGHRFMREERYAEAATTFRRVARDYPELREQAELHLASALVVLGRKDEAIDAFASVDDDLTDIDHQLRSACEALGDTLT